MAHGNEPISSAITFLDALIGKKCWAAIAGDGTGSMVSFNFGEKIRRERPLRNLKLPLEVREFDAEYIVFVEGGARWMVENNGTMICTSDDSNEDGGAMLTGLSLLVGKAIVSTKGSENLLDLELLFEEGLCFQMTCRAEGMTGYSLLYGDEAIATVGGAQ